MGPVTQVMLGKRFFTFLDMRQWTPGFSIGNFTRVEFKSHVKYGNKIDTLVFFDESEKILEFNLDNRIIQICEVLSAYKKTKTTRMGVYSKLSEISRQNFVFNLFMLFSTTTKMIMNLNTDKVTGLDMLTIQVTDSSFMQLFEDENFSITLEEDREK